MRRSSSAFARSSGGFISSPLLRRTTSSNARLRKFLWLSSGLFSAASFTNSAVGYLAFGTADGAATNFLAAVVSACLFGVASLLHFGPDEA